MHILSCYSHKTNALSTGSAIDRDRQDHLVVAHILLVHRMTMITAVGDHVDIAHGGTIIVDVLRQDTTMIDMRVLLLVVLLVVQWMIMVHPVLDIQKTHTIYVVHLLHDDHMKNLMVMDTADLLMVVLHRRVAAVQEDLRMMVMTVLVTGKYISHRVVILPDVRFTLS